ncbi:hypothetical protein PR202_gn00898 [Eleusine coracana subsp. coracana]|uniref:VWFA domain-containing protein n=1 Tax=Eleusine coracana subsp. coracana TaxID=191504 RepID=A0AAV5G5C6_ELECO|nr:hypothetical protein PR202_gn00898 [Eleusine coracana subsp. coracana]
MSSFNDDEQNVPASNSSNNNNNGASAAAAAAGTNNTNKPTLSVAGKVQLSVYKNETAPLEENRQQILLELTGAASAGDRPGLDLVAVLAVSGSMDGEKLSKMKTAMLFVIKKLSNIDRLSVVSFSDGAARLCPLRFVTEASQKEFKALVDGLVARGGTNITDGLRTGLKVLAGRRLAGGRVVSVMLMSDGQQTTGDARNVDVGNVPVYTFGFGADHHDAALLDAVARKSMGGTFNYVQDGVNLSGPFSQLLAGLLTVVVQDLKLTVTPTQDEAVIEKVDPGSYPQQKAGESVTVSFGDLSSRRAGAAADPDAVKPEVQTELARRMHAAMIGEARAMADGNNLGDAKDKIVEAQNALEDILEQSSPVVDMLRTELQQLLRLMKSQEMYEKQGRAYALSSETSHARQRFAARGDVGEVRLFATPRMDKYLEQAKIFDDNPDAPLPSADDDVKEEIAANPLAPIAGPIAFYIQAAIKALQAIEMLVTAAAQP